MSNLNVVEILLVEDNPADAELTLRALQKNHLANEVVWLTDGEQALDFIYARNKFEGRNMDIHPRLILLDLNLPRLNGLDVLRILKSDEKTRVIPVVVLTSSQQEKDIIESYHLGVNSYIVKPVEFDKFFASVNDLGIYWLLLNEPPPRA